MPHHRARMTPRGREMVVRRVVDDGMSFAQAAAWGNVSKSTVWEWVGRWRTASAVERESLVCLEERSSRPHRSPSRCPADEEQRICELRRRTGWSPRTIAMLTGRPHSTVYEVLRRGVVRGGSPPSARRSSAMSGPVPGICCTWTSRSSPGSPSPGTR
jgi:transposase